MISECMIFTARVAKVTFSQAFVCSTWGAEVTPNSSCDRSHGLGGGLVLGEEVTSPRVKGQPPPPPRPRYILELRSMGGWYAS